MSNGLHFLTVAEAGRLISSRKLSPVELTETLLSRIEQIDPQLNVYITVTAELARKRAREAETEIMRGEHRGPLHGIPGALKDIYNTVYEAGAILLGKLATSEYAHGGPSFDAPWPPARNPWHTAHFTGGSSSGSAAAVAAGLALGALGSDTGGSIRIPAAYCGTVGLKPTYGLVSRHGVVPNSCTFDHCGPLTWTVEDAAIVLQAIAGHDRRDPASGERPAADYRSELNGDIRGARIGVIRHFWEEDLPLGAEVCAAMEAAIHVLTQLGARVETVKVRPLRDFFDVKIIIVESEIFAVHQKDSSTGSAISAPISWVRRWAADCFKAWITCRRIASAVASSPRWRRFTPNTMPFSRQVRDRRRASMRIAS